MNKLSWLGWVLTVGGLLLAAGGDRLGISGLTQMGAFLLVSGLA